MNDHNDTIIWEAEFNPKVKMYWLLSGTIILLCTIVGVVLLPFWWVLGMYFTNRYLKSMRCALTDRSIILNKGILVRREKTVPLDKITDVALAQGPIMRSMDLYSLAFETAGQSANSMSMATLSVNGIANAREFRNTVLKQRDQRIGENNRSTPTTPPSLDSATASGNEQQLEAILEVLKRIESKMNG